MMIKICLVLTALAACGDDLAPAPDAPPAHGTSPTISGVFPDRAFLGREARIEISGDATHWSDGTTVGFGPDVDVHAVTVASPTSLFVDLTVHDTASAPVTDITIDGADGPLVLHAVFEIIPPLAVTSTGTLAQGSTATLHVTNLDFDHPFDTTTHFGGIDVDIAPPPGVTVLGIDDVTAFELVAELAIDVDAQPGELVVESGPIAHTLPISAGVLPIAPRTATPIVANTPAEGGPLDPFGSALFTFTPAPPPSVTLVATDTLSFTLLGASGQFTDEFTSSPVGTFAQLDAVQPLTEQYFLIAQADANAIPTYQVDVTSIPLVAIDETTRANDTAATAQAIQVPALVANATLSSDRDVDFVAFPVTAADAGKVVNLMVQGEVESQVDVFADAAGTILLGEVFGPEFDDLTTLPIPVGTQKIFVKFSSGGGFDSALNDYVAAIFLTQPH